MKVGRDVLVIDTREWLPDYGETTVDVATDGRELSVIIEFDGEEVLERKKLVFTSVCSFTYSSFPGVATAAFAHDQAHSVPMDALAEYPDSEAAAAWTRHFPYGGRVRHYAICFLSANKSLTVFACGVALVDME